VCSDIEFKLKECNTWLKKLREFRYPDKISLKDLCFHCRLTSMILCVCVCVCACARACVCVSVRLSVQ
jgi:hypothetical protein